MRTTVQVSREWAEGLLLAAGMSAEHAGPTVRALLLAECWGVTSHGLMRLPSYLTRLTRGGYRDGDLVTVHDAGPVVAFDGRGGLGHWQVWHAAQVAAERAARLGVAAVSVANSGHCGALGVHTLPVLERGMVALVFSHGPAAMPAWGGSSPLLSTSPLAVGIPCRPRPAIVDLATSTVARGTVAEHAARDEPLATGWAFDSQGVPTTDARVALRGMLAPLGGAKGFALAYVVEALTAAMVGPRLSADVADPFAAELADQPQGIGHLVVALDPAALSGDGAEAARERFDQLAARTLAGGGRVPGAARRLPEEIPDREVLVIADTTWSALTQWAQRLEVTTPVEGHDGVT
jgi:(2R)-3-sulfolactate dehydrogenase (NADP+)